LRPNAGGPGSDLNADQALRSLAAFLIEQAPDAQTVKTSTAAT